MLAITLWVVPMVVIGVMVSAHPGKRSVTSVYHDAVDHWWAQESLYSGFDYHYLPHFAVLFTPFHLLPIPAGDLLWRFLAAGLIMGGLWRLCRSFAGPETPKWFLTATLVSLPLSLPALRNGQANAMLAGFFLYAISSLPRGQWWIATLCLVLGIAAKQLGIVLLLLAVVVYAPLRWRVVIALMVLMILPFLFGHTTYVVGQHRQALVHLQDCVVVTQHRFADINGLLRTFGTALPPEVSKIVRLLAGGVTLGLWWLGAHRLKEPLRAVWLYALAAVYLMLFNPMTEANSYAIIAPALGAWAAWFLFGPAQEKTRTLGWSVVSIALTMGILPNLLRPWFGNHFALFWYPAMTMIFLAMLIGFIWRDGATVERARIQPA